MKAIWWFIFLLTLASLMSWAFTGVTWWTPTDGEPGRAVVIGWFHIFGILGPWVYLSLE